VSDYASFVSRKLAAVPPAGLASVPDLNPLLFDFQRDIVGWALRRGRAAIFADCGMGKTAMQLEWAHRVVEATGGRVLILAPLAVAQQTVREGEKFGIPCAYSRTGPTSAITITNYEMLPHFDPADFAGVVLDESSILKAYDGKTRTAIIDAFQRTPYRLACTATPAPNDYMELGNHSEFLGVMPRTEMLSMYFVHDGGETQVWRLKGHAEDAFWKWICSWAVTIREPGDLGYSNEGFALPPLTFKEHVTDVDQSVAQAAGFLFAQEAQTLQEQRATRRASLADRVAMAADLANSDARPWVIWCELNDESEMAAGLIDGAIEVSGSMDNEEKERRVMAFGTGAHRAMVSKMSICGFGLNWQHCPNVVFVGASHSYEQTYQAIRRCWRFGQKQPVTVHFIRAETDSAITANMKRKERDAQRMAASMLEHMRAIQTEEIQGTVRRFGRYEPKSKISIPQWLTSEAA